MADDMVSIPLSSDDETLQAVRSNHSGSSLSDKRKQIGTPLSDLSLDCEHVEEKSRLISQVFQLQNTLDDLAQRVDAVKDENVKLKSENQILGQYIENLMAASSVFQGNKGKNKVEKGSKERRK